MPRHFFSPSTRLFPMLLSALLISIASATDAQTWDAGDRTVAAVQADASAQMPQAGNAHARMPAEAQSSAGPQAAPGTAQLEHRLAIGSATQQLFDMQSTLPGLRPRHIDGEQASRSYQRYLKSFETAIPEKYETGVSAK